MTLLSPGQSPPQVTIPTRVFDGSKKICRRGPPASKPGSSLDRRRRARATIAAVSSSSTRSLASTQWCELRRS